MAQTQTSNTNLAGQPLAALLGSAVQNPEMSLLDRIDGLGGDATSTDASAGAQTDTDNGQAGAGVTAQDGSANAASALDIGSLLGASGSAGAGTQSGLLDPGILTSLLSGAGGGLPAGTAVGDLVSLSNNLVLDFHAFLEAFADTAGIAYAAHAVTAAGENLGAGKVGTSGLLNDALSPLAAAGLPTQSGSIDNIPSDLTSAVDHLSAIPTSLGQDLASPYTGSLLNTVENGQLGLAPIVSGINDTANEAASLLQNLGTHIGVPGTAGGVDQLLGATGLGSIGGGNLISDTVNATTGLVPGSTPQESLDRIPSDIAHAAGAVGNVVSGAASDLSFDHGGFLGNTLGGTPVAGVGSAAGSALDGIGHTLSQGIASAGSTLAGAATPVTGALDGVLPQVAGTVASVAGTTGLPTGHDGPVGTVNQAAAGTVTPILHEIGSALGGQGGGDAGSPVTAISGLAGGDGGGAGHAVSGLTGLLGGAGGGDPLAAVTHLAGSATGNAPPASAHGDGLVGSLAGFDASASSNAPAASESAHAAAPAPDPALDVSHVLATVAHAAPESHGLLHL